MTNNEYNIRMIVQDEFNKIYDLVGKATPKQVVDFINKLEHRDLIKFKDLVDNKIKMEETYIDLLDSINK